MIDRTAAQKAWQELGHYLHETVPAMDHPDVGDQVWFYECLADRHSDKMLALVTSIHPDDNTLSLAVFAPNGTVHARSPVTLFFKKPSLEGPTPPYFAMPKW